ncbi:MAG: hypothetical protein CL846_00555 [Crocinitomicaceae bacterium]|nr:hypothetical protein [Crocinitomicaceae bacterium]
MRFTVGKKIGFGFGIVVLLLLIVFSVTFSVVSDGKQTLEDSIKKNDKFLQIDQPSFDGLNHLKDNLSKTHNHMQNWTNEQTRATEVFKLEAALLLDSSLYADLKSLDYLSDNWDTIQIGKATYDNINLQIKELIDMYNFSIRDLLPDFESYEDQQLLAQGLLDEEILPIYQNISTQLDGLIRIRSDIAKEKQQENNESFKDTNKKFSSLSQTIFFVGIILLIGTFIIAFFTTLSITKPVQRLKRILLNLGNGVFPSHEIEPSNDEIGEMSVAMNSLVKGLKETTQFAHEVGQSNFKYPYQPLSEDDVLGHALLKMKDELAETERILEQKVKERTEEVVRQKDEIDNQKSKLEELYNDVTDSIRYAKRLQDSILPPDRFIKKLFPSSFVLFKPKDIVSGDFYWVNQIKDEMLFASVDCTGHGVPGAFMSLVGANGLNAVLNDKSIDKTGPILDALNKYASESLNKTGDENAVRDGMDISICSLNRKTNKIQYSGAYNPLYLIRDNELQVFKTDKFAIGSFEPGTKNYETFTLDVKKGDIIYLFSDGYADQFGGLKGKKFMYRQFKETLIKISSEPMEKQKELLDQKIEAWRGSLDQIDDILVMGVKV